jgi:hypothetical protein
MPIIRLLLLITGSLRTFSSSMCRTGEARLARMMGTTNQDEIT